MHQMTLVLESVAKQQRTMIHENMQDNECRKSPTRNWLGSINSPLTS